MAEKRWVSILVALVGASIVAVLYHYNQQRHTYEEYLVTNIAVLFWLPVMLVTFVIRQEPSGFGFTIGDSGRGYKLAAILFLAALPVYVFAARLDAFQSYYPIQKQAAHDLAYFGYFELTYGMYLFCWEFFFRGFLLFGLARLIGPWSVPVQAVAFGLLHYGKPGPEFLISFAAGVILGFVALRAKSFLPCFALHWASAVTFDVLVILAAKGLLF
jgi:membrane protease YdiL (CAAX protease family)